MPAWSSGSTRGGNLLKRPWFEATSAYRRLGDFALIPHQNSSVPARASFEECSVSGQSSVNRLDRL